MMHEVDEEEPNADPQTKSKERQVDQVNSQSDSALKNAEIVDYVYCMKIWGIALLKALTVVIPVLVMLWNLFLPSLVLRRDLLLGVKTLLYERIGAVFHNLSVYGFNSIYGVCIFGFYFFQKSLYYCYLPGMILSTFTDVFISDLVGDVIYFFALLSSIVLVYREKLPNPPPKKLIDEFERKKKIAKPLGKMIVVIFFVYFTVQFIYPIFLDSTFQARLAIRFIFLPIMITCCTSLQMHFLKPVQKKHMDYLIPILLMTSGILKMYERIFTNGMFNSGDYTSLVGTTFAAAIIEVANHFTYFYRHAVVDKMARVVTKFRKGKNRSVQAFSAVANVDSEQDIGKQTLRMTILENGWLLDLRKRLIIEDISIELIMIFTVTFLLYFVHPLIENKKAEIIPTFEICIAQLLIQIVFEHLSDIFGIYWTISRHKIQLKREDVEIKNRWFWVWIFFILYQSLYIFWFLLSY
eukprot:TRINITY_DN9508_c0_g1_i1.p1 TRINITY_DN9508_c0_g1~~TRINITY_DN9508_c0_g1_i1.p1  ORF type:complete len:466 (+),score=75.27 TRINITY_DN9508_c0_g1_i1:128-1525(+)